MHSRSSVGGTSAITGAAFAATLLTAPAAWASDAVAPDAGTASDGTAADGDQWYQPDLGFRPRPYGPVKLGFGVGPSALQEATKKIPTTELGQPEYDYYFGANGRVLLQIDVGNESEFLLGATAAFAKAGDGSVLPFGGIVGFRQNFTSMMFAGLATTLGYVKTPDTAPKISGVFENQSSAFFDVELVPIGLRFAEGAVEVELALGVLFAQERDLDRSRFSSSFVHQRLTAAYVFDL